MNNDTPTIRDALRECPFCGFSTAQVFPPSRGCGAFVGCDDCQGQVFAMDETGAIKAWNTRAKPDVAELVAALEEISRDWNIHGVHEIAGNALAKYQGDQ